MSELSKAQKLAEAAKLRHKIEEEANAAVAPEGSMTAKVDEEAEEGMKDAAEKNIKARPQAVDKSLDGNLDIEAMGDVKGDGGDAKDYDDGDPAKALGVPVYKHGLAENRIDGSLEAGKREVFGQRISARTAEEQRRGKEALNRREAEKSPSKRPSATRTVVTDADADPDGSDGKSKAELAAEEAKRKVAEKEEAEAKAASKSK